MPVFLFKLFIHFFSYFLWKKDRDRGVFNMIIHFPNAIKSGGWARLKSDAWNSIKWMEGSQVFDPSPTNSQNTLQQEAVLRSRAGIWTGPPIQDVDAPASVFLTEPRTRPSSHPVSKANSYYIICRITDNITVSKFLLVFPPVLNYHHCRVNLTCCINLSDKWSTI